MSSTVPRSAQPRTPIARAERLARRHARSVTSRRRAQAAHEAAWHHGAPRRAARGRADRLLATRRCRTSSSSPGPRSTRSARTTTARTSSGHRRADHAVRRAAALADHRRACTDLTRLRGDQGWLAERRRGGAARADLPAGPDRAADRPAERRGLRSSRRSAAETAALRPSWATRCRSRSRRSPPARRPTGKLQAGDVDHRGRRHQGRSGRRR